MSPLERIHTAFLNFSRRAERVDDELLANSFVDTPPLLQRVSIRESQIVFGRRGTGKTHVLKYASSRNSEDDVKRLYIDLRLIGSNQSMYGDPDLPITERATRLVIDVLHEIGRSLTEYATQALISGGPTKEIADRISDLSNALSNVRVVGEHREESSGLGSTHSSMNASLSPGDGSAEIGFRHSRGHEARFLRSSTGVTRYHLSFGSAQSAVSSLIEIAGVRDLQIFIDEWSEIPLELQPLLADAIRKILLTNRHINVKIAAIEHRTSLMTPLETNQYIGFELGADIPTGLNLDDFLVFDNDQNKAVDFFKKLLFKHLIISDPDAAPETPDELQRLVFTERRAIEEFVRAVEGVPRDALNLVSILAEKRFGKSFGVPDVRSAAREWYTRDKAAVIDSNPDLADFMAKIIQDVIRGRKARAFLVQSSVRDRRIEALFDLRVLHILKRNVSSNENPGLRYDVYKFDYGCYVDLISTASAPDGLFEADQGEWVDVPVDDYRSIRRAILNVADF